MFLIALFILGTLSILQSAPQVGDTLKYRIIYFPTWCFYELAPWEMDWRGATHVVLFMNGNMTKTSPYWSPVVPNGGGGVDSMEVEFGSSNGATHYLDSLVSVCHRQGIKIMTTIQCVGGDAASAFDYISSDSARTQVFHNALKGWITRKHLDGWDLDLEDASASQANQIRFIRIGRKVGGTGIVIGIAAGRGLENNWTASQVDPIVDLYDMQMYTYEYMWNGSANATWFQTPVNSPASCTNCENSSLTKDFLYGGIPFVQGWVNAGHDKSKIVLGLATSCVAGFTGTDQLSVAWSNSISDNRLKDVEAMVNYGGVKTKNTTAKSSYISGTAKAGNPLGIGTGTKFFLPFEDSTDIKSIIDYAKSVGVGGIMFYDSWGDLKNNSTPDIHVGAMYAAKLNGGLVPSPVVPPVDTIPPIVPPSTDTSGNWTKIYNLGYLAGIKSVQLIDTTGIAKKWYQKGVASVLCPKPDTVGLYLKAFTAGVKSVICPPVNCPAFPDTLAIRQAGIKQGESEFTPINAYIKK